MSFSHRGLLLVFIMGQLVSLAMIRWSLNFHVNVALFENSLCKCNQVKMKSYQIKVDPSPLMVPFNKGENLDTHTEDIAMQRRRQRLDWLIQQLKTSKDCLQLPEVRRGKESSPKVSRDSAALPPSRSQNSSLQNYEGISFRCFTQLSLWSFIWQSWKLI